MAFKKITSEWKFQNWHRESNATAKYGGSTEHIPSLFLKFNIPTLNAANMGWKVIGDELGRQCDLRAQQLLSHHRMMTSQIVVVCAGVNQVAVANRSRRRTVGLFATSSSTPLCIMAPQTDTLVDSCPVGALTMGSPVRAAAPVPLPNPLLIGSAASSVGAAAAGEDDETQPVLGN